MCWTFFVNSPTFVVLLILSFLILSSFVIDSDGVMESKGDRDIGDAGQLLSVEALPITILRYLIRVDHHAVLIDLD